MRTVDEVHDSILDIWPKLVRRATGLLPPAAWNNIAQGLRDHVTELLVEGSITEFEVVCDATLNPPAIVAGNGVRALVWVTANGNVYRFPLAQDAPTLLLPENPGA